MKRTLTRFGAVAVVACLLPGCATIVRGTMTKYQITSTPSEADVALSTGEHCSTPCKVKMKRKNGFTATITKVGYEPHVTKVDSKISGGGGVAGAGNLLFGGVVGGAVDGSTGALNSFFPGSIDAQLKPIATVEPLPDASATPGTMSAPTSMPAATSGAATTVTPSTVTTTAGGTR